MVSKVSIRTIAILLFTLVSTIFATEPIQDFTTTYVEKEIKKQIIDHYSFISPENINVLIKNNEIFKNHPSNAAFFTIEYPSKGTLLGKRLFSVIFYNNRYDVVDIQRIATDTSAKALVYYTTRKVKSNSQLSVTDLKQKLVMVSSHTDQFNITKEEILSMQAARSMAAGTVLSSKWLEPIPTIQQGEYVTAIIAKKGFQLEVPAQALDKGMTGEYIRIKTNISDKIIRGEISHEKSVIINSI